MMGAPPIIFFVEKMGSSKKKWAAPIFLQSDFWAPMTLISLVSMVQSSYGASDQISNEEYLLVYGWGVSRGTSPTGCFAIDELECYGIFDTPRLLLKGNFHP